MSEGAGDGNVPATGVPPGALSALLQEVAAAPEIREAELPSLPAGAVVGRFEIIRELGQGGFGVVYEARDPDLGRPVAVKLVRPGCIADVEGRVHREAEAIARLSHPNLITLFEVGRSDHGPFLVFELLRGKTLQERIDAGPMPVQEAVHLATEVARGLAHAHAEGVIHRDLKPANVFVTTRGQVKILDFGMAHAFGRRRVSGGTPAYMAPEQWEDDPEDERTDVFALGVMLYRMLTGEYPFPAGKGRWAAEPGTPRTLEVPGAPELGELIERMLDRTPKGRPRDGAAVLAALAPVEDRLRSRPADGQPPEHARRRKVTFGERAAELKPFVVAAVLLVIATAGAGGWYAWTRVRENRSAPARPGAAPSIAVLPFTDMSAGKDQEYFAEGVAEEILGALSRVPGLRVPGRASSFWFRDKNADPAEIARKLGVTHLLEGTVRRSGSKVRITAEVVKASSGERVWSETYEREIADVFAIQDEIARSVVRELAPMLLARTPPPAPATTTDPEAYRLFLLGRALNAKGTQESYRRAKEALERSVAIDPRFAPAQAYLAVVLGNASLAERGEERRRLRSAGKAAAERAVAIDPSSPWGYVGRAWYRMRQDLDWAGASEDIDRALALDPNNESILNVRALLLNSLGRTGEAVDLERRAVDLSPLNAVHTTNLAYFLLSDGQHAEAREWARRSLEISPENARAHMVRGYAALATGDGQDALASFGRSEEPIRSAGSVAALHSLGREQESRDALVRLERDYPDEPVHIAGARAWRGDRDGAFAYLHRAVRERDPTLAGVKNFVLLRPLHGDPRFDEVLRSLNLPVDQGTGTARPVGTSLATPSIAVLPFADMSPRHDQEYFADGVAEEILNALANVEGLRVPARSSSFLFRGKEVELAEVGRKLRVTHVLEGSVRRSGKRVRVTAKIVDVAGGHPVWSETFDRDEVDIFAVQDQVARATVAALKVKVLPNAGSSATAGRVIPEAYDQYLAGRKLISRWNPDDVRRGIAALERAVERDPSFAPAWARLATALPWLEGGGEQGARAIAAAERAVVLAPGWAGAYTARALTRNHLQLDFAGADEDLARAQALAPGSGQVLLTKCILERSRGRLSESAAACRGANDLDPLGVAARNQLTKTYLAMGDLSRARQANGEAFERSPGSSSARVYRCWLDILEGNRGAAQDHCGSDLNDDDRRFAATIMAQTWGTPAEAEQGLAAFSAKGGEGAASWIAMVHAWRGDADRALEWLERAYARREPALADVQGSPFLRKLAPDPRWRAFLRKMTLPTDGASRAEAPLRVE